MRIANVAGDDQNQPACPADPSQVAAQSGTVRMVVVAEHDAGLVRSAVDSGRSLSQLTPDELRGASELAER